MFYLPSSNLTDNRVSRGRRRANFAIARAYAPEHSYASGTQDIYARMHTAEMTPRIARAALRYGMGLDRTMREACKNAQLANLDTLSLMATAGNPAVLARISEGQQLVEDQSMSTSQVVDRLARKALGKLDALMESSASEAIQFSAARDLADRGSETSKQQRIQAQTFSVTADASDSLRAAIAESTRVRELHSESMKGDFVRVDTAKQVPALFPAEKSL